MNSRLIILSFTLLICVAYGQANLECPRSGPVGICIQECEINEDCKDLKLCCSTGCGRVCKKGCPVPVCNRCIFGFEYVYGTNGCRQCRCLPNPCRNFVCPRGQRCVLQNVQCIQAPCNPVPQCVASF